MIISRLSQSPGGATVLPGSRLITAPFGDPPRRVFRDTRYIRFVTGGLAEELLVDADDTVLTASFEPYTYDACEPPEPSLAASKSAIDGNTVKIELDAPREIVSVHVSGSGTRSGLQLELYRLDGDRVARDPSATADVDATIDVRGVEHESHARKAAARGSPSGEFSDRDGAAFTGSQRGKAINNDAVFSFSFTDARFAVRLRDSGGDLRALAQGDIERLLVRSVPTSPRIGVAFPEDGAHASSPAIDAPSFVWRADGVIDGSTASQGNALAGSKVASELARASSRLASVLQVGAASGSPAQPPAPPVPLPAVIDVALVFESDAPCRVTTSALHIAYRLARSSFPEGEPKKVLRFDGGANSAREVELTMPGTATLLSARIQGTASFRGDRPASAVTSDGEGRVTVEGRQDGVLLRAGVATAQSVIPTRAVTASGISLGVMTLTTGAEMRVSLHEDYAGAPTGRMLAEGTLAGGRPGRRAWLTLDFADLIVLGAQPYWLVATAAAGEAVWLTAPGAEPLRIVEAAGESASWSGDRVVQGSTAAYRVLSRNGAPGADAVLTVRVGMAEAIVSSVADDPDKKQIDLTPALAAYLAAAHAADSVRAPVSIASEIAGLLTLYPPRVEYDTA